MSREDEIIQKTVDVLTKSLHPSRIVLFGSRAKGTAHHGSDFDFALDMSRPAASINRHIQEKIEQFSGLYGVDLIFLNDVSQDFREIVLTTGKTVYEQ